MRIKELLHKPFGELADEEFKYIGRYFQRHPEKLKRKAVTLHKCVDCKNLVWYASLGRDLWQCLLNPCDDLATQSDRLMTNNGVGARRRCDGFKYDPERRIPPPRIKK